MIDLELVKTRIEWLKNKGFKENKMFPTKYVYKAFEVSVEDINNMNSNDWYKLTEDIKKYLNWV